MTLRHPVLSTLFGFSDAMKGRDDVFMFVLTERASAGAMPSRCMWIRVFICICTYICECVYVYTYHRLSRVLTGTARGLAGLS